MTLHGSDPCMYAASAGCPPWLSQTLSSCLKLALKRQGTPDEKP